MRKDRHVIEMGEARKKNPVVDFWAVSLVYLLIGDIGLLAGR
jgi:hypothetical protein